MKLLNIIILFLFFGISFVVMESGQFIKNVKIKDESIQDLINETKTYIEDEDFSNARENVEKMEKNFKIIINFIQFSVERDETLEFVHNLSQLKGYLLVEDKDGALVQILLVNSNWDKIAE